MATITSFEELEIWKEARRLYKKVLDLIKREEVAKDFRFKNNFKEAAGSVMDNIAEGFERDSRLEFVNALSYSKVQREKFGHSYSGVLKVNIGMNQS